MSAWFLWRIKVDPVIFKLVAWKNAVRRVISLNSCGCKTLKLEFRENAYCVSIWLEENLI